MRGEPDTTPDRPPEVGAAQGSVPNREPPPEPINPAHAQLGSEGLARLRARYAEVRAAIGRRVPDPARQDELKTLAERLNPDTWVTPDEVRAGLGQYESVLETVRNAVGRRRRRGPRPQDSAAAPDDGPGRPDREGAGGGVETESEDG